MRLTFLAVFFACTGLSLHADYGYIVPLTISGIVTTPQSTTITDVTTTKGNTSVETIKSTYTPGKITNASILSFLATTYPAIVANTNYSIVLVYTRQGYINGIFLVPKGATPTSQNIVDLYGYLRFSNSLLLTTSLSRTITRTVNPPAVKSITGTVTELDAPTFVYRGYVTLQSLYNATFAPAPKSLDSNEIVLTKGTFTPLIGAGSQGILNLQIVQLNLVLGKAQVIPDISVFANAVNEIP